MASTRGTRLFAGLGRISRRSTWDPLRPSASGLARRTAPSAVCTLVPTRSMVDFASNDVLGIEKLHRSVPKTQMETPMTTQSQSQKMLQASMSLLHGKGASVVSDRCFSDMLRPALDALTENDAIFVDNNFPERHLLTSCKAQIHAIDVEDNFAVQTVLRRSSARTKLVIVENGSTAENMRQLKKLCGFAKEHQAKLILSDTHGTILMRHITGSEPELLAILQQPDVICSNLDLISGTNKVSCVSGEHTFVDSLTPSRYEGTINCEAITDIFERFRLLPGLGTHCSESLRKSRELKRSLEELGFPVKMHGLKLLIPARKHNAHTVVSSLWDSGVQVNCASDGEETGILLGVQPAHSNEDIRSFLAALCDTLDVPVVESAFSRFRQREPVAARSWTAPEMRAKQTTPRKSAPPPTISGRELGILESVYSWESYQDNCTKMDDGPSESTDPSSVSMMASDPTDNGHFM